VDKDRACTTSELIALAKLLLSIINLHTFSLILHFDWKMLHRCPVEIEIVPSHSDFIRRWHKGRYVGNNELSHDLKVVLDKEVVGSYAYCGCNFSVMAIMDVKGSG
jgi:hypothetical protein